jgi:hypothetical protein
MNEENINICVSFVIESIRFLGGLILGLCLLLELQKIFKKSDFTLGQDQFREQNHGNNYEKTCYKQE